MSKKTMILFDFDGVIADSFAAAFGTAKARCVHRTEEGYKKLFEDNIYVSDKPREDGDHSDCDHDLDWWGTFSSIFEQKGGLFTHMDVVVRKLAEEHTLVIVSSSVHRIITSFLDSQGLSECFSGIYDADIHTSKSEKIGMIFDKFGVSADQCVMITDSKGDILEAREKNVASIAVTWGFNGREVLSTGDPFRIVELPSEIPSAVAEFFHGKGTAA